jgi:hypothetical protein
VESPIVFAGTTSLRRPTMAQISTRRTANGVRYDVRTRIGRRVVSRTFKRRKDADAYASTVEADKLRGGVVDPRAGRVTLEVWCRSWLACWTPTCCLL